KQQSFAEGGPGYVIPEVGDSGCDVFAKLGRPDDIITKVNRRDVANLQQFRERTAGAEVLLLTIRRGNSRLRIPIQ
ncbi:MAG: hypothetical protein O7C69_06445, partial [Gammaproteobacteria bacterium]|nr:hypothetical protein [Gammaproteobacteria bacterium]